MRMKVFAGRNLKEMARDKLTIFFGLLFPVLILLLLWLIGSNVPGAPGMFSLENLTPGIAVFGLSFVSLFSATLISKDRGGMFLIRLYSSPLKPIDYIAGYALPLIPLSIIQGVFVFIVALILGLPFTPNIFLCVLINLPAVLLYIGLGLLCGSVLNDKQVGGICGALLTNLTAWLSGIWFDVSLLGKTFSKIAKLLPFANSVDAARAALAGNYDDILKPLLITVVYAIAIFLLAAMCFRKKMKD